MHQDKIVNVSAVVFNMQLLFYEMIQVIQLKISKNLTGQISNKQSTFCGRMKKTFIFWQIVPKGLVPFDKTILCGIVKNDPSGHIQ